MGTRLFIGRLPPGTKEDHIERHLRGYGEIREIALVDRFGFVEFRASRDAADVINDLNGKPFRGERIIIEYARSRNAPRERRDRREPIRGPPTRSSNRLIVENVSSRANWQDLKDHMRRAGEVCFADVHRDRNGEGIVEYERYDDMKYALEKLDNTDFRGHRIRLIEDNRSGGAGGSSYNNGSYRGSRRGRSRSPRRGRSPSHSRSRSPRRSRSPPRRSTRRSVSPRSRSPRRHGGRSRRSPSRSRSPARSPARRHARSPLPKRGSRSPSREPSPQRGADPHGESPGRSPLRSPEPARDAEPALSPRSPRAASPMDADPIQIADPADISQPEQ